MARVSAPASIASAALAAIAVVAPAAAGGGYSDLALGVGALVVWIALVAGVLSGRLLSRAPSPAFVAAAAFLLGLLLLTALSSSWANDDGAAFVEGVRTAGYLGVFVLAGSLARRGRTAPVFEGLAAGLVAVALLALGSRLLGLGEGDAALAASLPTASGRLSFPIGYWNALGAAVALALPLLVWIAADTPRRALRGLALAGFAPVLLAAYMTSSRGALIAAVVGLVVAVALAPDRRRSAATAIFGVVGAIPAIVAATLAPGILESPGDGSPGAAEIMVVAVLVGGMALTYGTGRFVDRLSGARLLGVRISARALVLGLGAVAALAIALAGPSALVGDLRAGTDGAETERTVGIVSASGSGRTQFWSTALDAFATEPVRGIGAGGYEAYWSQNGSLRTPARNAHSEPLELLAELGPLGLLLFAGLLLVVLTAGVGEARRPGGGPAAAGTGLFAASLVGFAIDWTWQVPAVVVPVLIAGGVIAATATTLPRWLPDLSRPPARIGALAVVALAIPACWSATVLAAAASQLDDSADALEAGRLDEAASAARSAAAIEPWAAEPWLRLAAIEQAGDNLPAAMAAAAAAIERAPEDLRPWIVATNVQAELGNTDQAGAYAIRLVKLSPKG